MEEIIKNVITPNDKYLRTIFENSKAYFIDIYQREYKWKEENVKTLLEDIEVRFQLGKRIKVAPQEIQKDVLRNFEPYFLNTFLTSKTTENIAIVDGQQRLTTFLLVLIKLYKIIQYVNSNDHYSNKTYSNDSLKKLIYESDDFGGYEKFKIYNKNRESAFASILENEDIKAEDETQKKIVDNYRVISTYFDEFLKSENEEAKYDEIKTTYYISYILDKLSIVEIRIENPKNVAMIFEVVNDRGLGLNPYEILKGKLIGNLDALQKEQANKVWTKLQNDYFKNEVADIDLDDFFKTYFRSKFASSETEYERFEKNYHYEVYRNKKIRKHFGNFENSDLLFKRVIEDIKYFAELYLKLRTSYDYDYLIYNELLGQSQQYLLIMSNIQLNDPNENDKINEVSKRFDQFHTTLRLIDEYDSNSFQQFIHSLNANLRNKSIEEIKTNFDSACIIFLEERGVIDKGKYNEISELYKFTLFKNMRHKLLNFTKYVFMRVDRFLSYKLDKPSYVSGDLKSLESRFNQFNRKRYGLHLEHIIANNEKNKKLFINEDGQFDELLFNQIRNKLGALVLLKDKQNLSSGNDIYRRKTTTYKKSNFIWNEFLVGHVDKFDISKLPAEIDLKTQSPDKNGLYSLDSVEVRQRELFDILKEIWGK